MLLWNWTLENYKDQRHLKVDFLQRYSCILYNVLLRNWQYLWDVFSSFREETEIIEGEVVEIQIDRPVSGTVSS